MSRRDAGAAPSVVALARTAMARGQAALGLNDLQAALRWLDRAHRLVPQDPNVTLALASARLLPDPAHAALLFAEVTERYDVRQAWMGLAAARLRMAGPSAATAPLATALARFAYAPDTAELADDIARRSGAPGWCGLTSDGSVVARPATSTPIEIRLDGEPIHGPKLPAPWINNRRVEVLIGGQPALGSPIEINTIRRVAGCVEAWEGGLRGWAWHPGDAASPVVLTFSDAAGLWVRRVCVEQETDEVADLGPLARPRFFWQAPGDLVGTTGLIHVRGEDGKDLMGSPLDPSAEQRALQSSARLLARLYPAGICTATDISPPSPALRAQAPVPSQPEGAEGRRRTAAVVIPVHNRADVVAACLSSVLASVAADTPIVVVDDGSSEPAVIALLDGLARQRRIRLVRHPRALGFPASANAGMAAAKGRDVVLLNSDTLVPQGTAAGASSGGRKGWLERLRDAAHSARDIGSVTPFSNDASILSYPGKPGCNPRPDQAATNRLDRVAQAANGGAVVDIPVGVGFCLYLRRDCLNAVGLFRADLFAQGYGEENDFCLRARRLGWRNVALTGLFIGHHGGSSFGGSALHLRARNARIIEQLHPGHHALIQAFVATDPLAPARRRMDLRRWRARSLDHRQAAILITHNDGGGVEQRVAAAVQDHARAGRRPIVLRPAERADGARAIAVHGAPTDDFPNLIYSMPREFPALLRLLRSARPSSVEVHHLLGHPPVIHQLLRDLAVSYDVHVHDYAWFCPRVSLVGAHDRYCGEPDIAECDACVSDLGHFLDEDISASALRNRSAALLRDARQVVTPSHDTRVRLSRHFPGLTLSTVAHEDDEALAFVADRASLNRGAPNGRLRVCVVGGIGVHKGYDVLLACARDATRRELKLEFIIVGNTIDDERMLATGRVFVTGRYQPNEAVGLIRAQGAQLGFVPSICPETWCLGLGDLWRAGLPTAAFDIGAPAERIRRTKRGFMLPLGLSASAINNALVAAVGEIHHAWRHAP